MSEGCQSLGDILPIPGTVCALLVLGCVLRQRRHLTSRAVWPLCTLALLECCLLPGCQGRGRLVDPPSRASMWRYGFVNPVDFGDDRVDCGGFERQWRKNRGRCGVCGDPWDEAEPRQHETRGKYGRGTIVRTYTQAQTVVVEVEVTAASTGHFEYRLCPRGSVWEQETHDCFTHLLKDDQGRSEIPVSVSHKFARLRHVLRLPKGVSCPACVLQWKFVTVNRAGRAEYRACADITITPAATTITTATEFSATTVFSSDNFDTSESGDHSPATDTALQEPPNSTVSAISSVLDSEMQNKNSDEDVQTLPYEVQNDDSGSEGADDVLGGHTRLQGDHGRESSDAGTKGAAVALPATLHHATLTVLCCVVLFSCRTLVST